MLSPEEDIALLNLLDYYTLSFLGSAMSTSELGMPGVAASEFETHFTSWLVGARAHLKKILEADDTTLVYNAPADQLSTGEFINLMDFVDEKRRGIEWVDEFKKKRRPFSSSPPPEDLVQTCKKLAARGNVLQAEQEHLRLLAKKNVSACTFVRETDRARKALGVDAVCVLSLPGR